MCATEFFAVMDFNGSGTLTREKFLEFWRRLKREGITDDEIIVQLEMTKMREMWIGFEPSKIKEVALSDAKKMNTKIDNSVDVLYQEALKKVSNVANHKVGSLMN